MDSLTTDAIVAHTAVGAAAALDESVAEHDMAELRAGAACYGTLLVLLREARAALRPEFCLAPADCLAGRIDAILLHRAPEHSADDLVWTRLPSGEFSWLRPEVDELHERFMADRP
jgi:hypothetical protein